MVYKISIIRADNGGAEGDYLVNHYHKAPDIRLSTFAEIVNQLFEYAKRPEIFIEEPVLRNLGSEEEKAVKSIRALVLEQRVLTSK